MESSITATSIPIAPWQEAAWWILTIAMFLAWWTFFARKYAKEFSLSERILAAFVAQTSQILAVTFILNLTYGLSWWPMGLTNAGITVGLILLTRVSRRAGEGKTLITDIADTFKSVWRLMNTSVALWIITVTGLLAAAWVIYIGQLFPPFCYDAWGYHYGWAAFAKQEGHLGPFAYPNPHINFYPKNTEILFLWWIIGAGTERWANIVQAPFGFATAIASYLLARRVGARRRDALLAGMLVFSIPTVLHQMWMGMVDLSTAAGTLTAVAFLSRRRLTTATIVLAGCAAGFMIGTKGTGIYSFIGLFLFLLYRLFPLGYDALRVRPLARLGIGFLTLLLFGVFSFAFGSYFYMRNWINEGNPTGAWKVEVGPYVLFKGERGGVQSFFTSAAMPDVLFEALEEGPEWPIVLDGFFDPQEGFAQGNRIGGWGSPWTVLMLPAIPMAIVWGIVRRRWKIPAIILAFLIPYFLFTYNHTWTRFILPVIGAGPPAFAYLYSMIVRTRPGRWLLPVAAVLMVATMFSASHHDLLRIGTIEAARKVPYPYNDRYALFHSWGDEEFADAIRSVQEPGTSLGFSNMLPDSKILALWNPTFTNRAIWLPWRTDGEGWEKSLRDEGIYAVYVGPESRPMVHAMSNPDVFEALYEGKMGGIYRLVQSDEPE